MHMQNCTLKAQGEHKVGYARLRDFNSVVASRLREALVDMKKDGADEFILDLRGNGGGAFQSALGVAGLFMNDKPITYIVSPCLRRSLSLLRVMTSYFFE